MTSETDKGQQRAFPVNLASAQLLVGASTGLDGHGRRFQVIFCAKLSRAVLGTLTANEM
jgi:hypothetical protein